MVLLDGMHLIWRNNSRLLSHDAILCVMKESEGAGGGNSGHMGGTLQQSGNSRPLAADGSDSDDSDDEDNESAVGSRSRPSLQGGLPFKYKAAEDEEGKYDRVRAMVTGWLSAEQRRRITVAMGRTCRCLCRLMRCTAQTAAIAAAAARLSCLAVSLVQRFAVFAHREVTAGIGLLKGKPERDGLPDCIEAIRELCRAMVARGA